MAKNHPRKTGRPQRLRVGSLLEGAAELTIEAVNGLLSYRLSNGDALDLVGRERFANYLAVQLSLTHEEAYAALWAR